MGDVPFHASQDIYFSIFPDYKPIRTQKDYDTL